jgi:putative SOS response-associated peptidase YedK
MRLFLERKKPMCGRYALISPPDLLRVLFGYGETPNFPPRYNIAPTQPVPVVTQAQGQRHFTLMRWGFMPAWVKDPKSFPLVINIRGETVAEKPAFRAAFRHRRALMPVDGFYEWQREGRENRAYLFRKPDRGAFAFAALHETWIAQDGGEIDTVALVNGPANGLMSAIHPRCPVILDPADYAAWLDPQARPEDLRALLQPPSDDLLECVPIGPAINKVANDGPQVQAPFTAAADAGPDAKAAPARASKAAKKSAPDSQGSLF